MQALVSTKILEHLNNHPRVERETYEPMRQILLKRYGSKRTAQSVRDQFPHSKQEANESSEDFLDRLIRDYAIGFAHEQNYRIRHHDVLTVFMHGLSDNKLSESLETEYMKPCYADEPPTPADLRFYLNRLESSRSVRKSKQTNARSNNPYPRNQYAQRVQEQQQGGGGQLQDYLAPRQPEWTAQANKNANPLNPLRGPCHGCGMMGHFKRECQVGIAQNNGLNLIDSEHLTESFHLSTCPLNQINSSKESSPPSDGSTSTCGAEASPPTPDQGN